MIDLQQVSLALNLATNRSLIVIDEFGKGTEADGWWSSKLSLRVADSRKMAPA